MCARRAFFLRSFLPSGGIPGIRRTGLFFFFFFLPRKGSGEERKGTKANSPRRRAPSVQAIALAGCWVSGGDSGVLLVLVLVLLLLICFIRGTHVCMMMMVGSSSAGGSAHRLPPSACVGKPQRAAENREADGLAITCYLSPPRRDAARACLRLAPSSPRTALPLAPSGISLFLLDHIHSHSA